MVSVLQVKGVLLDMDGLLLDTERVAERCWHVAEKESGFSMPSGFYFTLIGQSMSRIEERLHEVMDPACDVEAFLKIANRVYHEAIVEGNVPVKEGAAELLSYLAERDIPRCLATSTFRKMCDHKLSSTGLARYIPERVTGDAVEHSKPAPDIYLEAARKTGLPPEQLMVLEDSENGLKSALAAGCLAVHVPDLAPVAIGIQQQASRVYRDLKEVLAAFRRDEIVIG
ncbi:MAG: HAD family hydrolase [Puniceicoccaceae bacterium]